MATRTRKATVIKNKSAAKPARRRPVRGAASRGRGAKQAPGAAMNFFVPLFFIFCILFCLGFLGLMGYRTVTASEFFDVKKIDVRGTTRASDPDIEKIVSAASGTSGVWNADLREIKERVERLAFVKSAAVSRVLPDGVRVNVVERVPRAIVRFEAGDYWVDEEGVILAVVGQHEQRFPFVLTGWDEAKTESALKANQERVRIYRKMLEDWQNFDLAKRVQTVDLSNLRAPRAVVPDSGQTVSIVLAREDFAKKLKFGLESIAGRGQDIAGIDVSDVKPVIEFRKKS